MLVGIAYSGTQASSTRLGTQTINFVTSTTINNDIERVKTYVPMAGPGFNPGASNPFNQILLKLYHQVILDMDIKIYQIR